MRLDPNTVRQQIENLKVSYPEIWDEGDEKLLTDCLEAETDLNEFLRVVVDRMQDSAAMAGGIASRIAEQTIRQDRFVRREKAMRALAFKLLQAADLPKIELPEATLSIRKGTPKVIITDDDAIEPAFCKVSYTPDRTKIKEALDAGELVAGAQLSNGEPSLSVRSK